jgi:hypothetical protein
MKFKFKTSIIFCISFFVILYPVYKFTNAKLKQFNLNEDLETFQINTFIKLEDFSYKFNEITKHLNYINQNLFEGKNVIQLKSSERSEEIFIVGQDPGNSGNTFNVRFEERIFYLPLVTRTLFNPFLDLQKLFKSSNIKECNEIIAIYTEFDQIDFTDYLLSSKITQPRAIDTKIEASFLKCLPESMQESIKVYIKELSILHKVKNNDNINLIDNFINANGNLFLNEDIKKKFKDDIIKIEKIFFENSSKKILQYHFNKPFNYKTKVQYRKDFSTLNVSIVMSLLLNILIFYVSYFFRIRLKFLNIIF